MNRQPPLVIHLPPMSDRSVVEIHRCLGALIDAFESSYELQFRRYYDRNPQIKRPARFEGEPF
jgi:hypothetical protein